MFATWIQIAELALLPLGLAVGYVAGRISKREERTSFRTSTVSHPGLVPEYPAHLPLTDPARALLDQSGRRARTIGAK